MSWTELIVARRRRPVRPSEPSHLLTMNLTSFDSRGP